MSGPNVSSDHIKAAQASLNTAAVCDEKMTSIAPTFVKTAADIAAAAERVTTATNRFSASLFGGSARPTTASSASTFETSVRAVFLAANSVVNPSHNDAAVQVEPATATTLRR